MPPNTMADDTQETSEAEDMYLNYRGQQHFTSVVNNPRVSTLPG